MADVRYWHKADIPNLAVNIRFRKVKADIGQAAGCNIHQHVPVQTYRVGLREQILVRLRKRQRGKPSK